MFSCSAVTGRANTGTPTTNLMVNIMSNNQRDASVKLLILDCGVMPRGMTSAQPHFISVVGFI